jgi:hypothetical protein
MAAKHDPTGRSRQKLTNFFAMERYIFASPAFRSLSLPARAAYLEMLNLYSGSNNGRIAMSANVMSGKLKAGRATANRALLELESKGFMEAMLRGGFNMKSGSRRATEWRLTCYRCDVTGERPAKTFMLWQNGKMHFTVSSQSKSGLISKQLQCST